MAPVGWRVNRWSIYLFSPPVNGHDPHLGHPAEILAGLWGSEKSIRTQRRCSQLRLSRTGDGKRCVLAGATGNPAMYAGEWLAAIPVRFHVKSGPEFRASVAAVTERLTAAHAAVREAFVDAPAGREGFAAVCGRG